MNILSILNELESTASINAKLAILERERDNELLKRVFQSAYNPMISYYIKQIPEYSCISDHDEGKTLENAIIELSRLSSREFTGNAAITHLKYILSWLTKSDATVLERIIQKDLRCGTSDTLASRVWPGLVPTFDVMLCDKDMSRIKYPAIAQRKMDGARVHLIYDGVSVKAFSRAGKEFQLLGALDEAAKMFMEVGETFDGELLVVDLKTGKFAERSIGNGILNKSNKGTISKEEAEMIVAVVWDIVDQSGTIPYVSRFETLVDRGLVGKMEIVDSIVVKSEEEAMEYFALQLKNKEEGAIIKNINSMWVPKRSKDLCKLKEINTGDLIVVDTFEGTGKYAGMIGGLTCQTSDGLLEVNVGTGFSDEDRAKDPSEYLGKIVEVLYNTKIKSKGKDKMSLFLPRLSVVRFDKTVANTIEELA